ncbi:integrase|uniref:tyrosine-type recombinase/integrase n=1 Tax=Pseudomonas sp. SbOxS1 TaxID=2723884 RepID=UPI0015D43200|nr:integrase family protein [Pseudomonas sp. SbOxS1]NYU05756.1 integrase [Pseudomonas sp. SbOxS1]
MSSWTDKTIQKAIRDAKAEGADIWLTDADKARGVGRLRLRASAKNRATFYFRYTTPKGVQAQISLGIYDSDGKAGLALKDATAKAALLSRLYQDGHRDLHTYLAQQKANEDESIAAKVRAQEEAERQATFGDLLLAYADMLKAADKASERAVRSQLKKDVEVAFPHLWKKPAKQITIDDCVEVVGKLNDEGKPRQADKIRSYIKSAYRAAINARGNVKAPKVMRELGITSNPARDIDKVKGSSEASERALSLAEFRAYWKRIQALEEPHRSVAMLHVLTGGQRMQQLARVTLADIDRDSMLMRMVDGKGKRERPRVYWVPLLPEALPCIDRLTLTGQYVFSSNGGVSPMGENFLSAIAKDVCSAMTEAKELQGEPFTGKVVRATIETRLMKKPYRVSSDVLARLLSHGLGGVQAKSYAHDPMHEEMLEALEKLWRLLNEEAEPLAEVIQLYARA